MNNPDEQFLLHRDCGFLPQHRDSTGQARGCVAGGGAALNGQRATSKENLEPRNPFTVLISIGGGGAALNHQRSTINDQLLGWASGLRRRS